jgi:hypothetical protein
MHISSRYAWEKPDFARRLGVDGRVLQAVATLQHVMIEKIRVSRAIENHTIPEQKPLPEGVDFPNWHENNGGLAKYLFNLAISADLHHELAHITLSHTPSGGEPAKAVKQNGTKLRISPDKRRA